MRVVAHVACLLVLTQFTWCEVVHGYDPRSCDSLNADARTTYRLNSIIETKDLSRAVSSTMIPMSAALPLGLWAGGVFGRDDYMGQTGVMLLLVDATTLGITYVAKKTFGRPRPWRAHPDCILAGEIDNEYSFPSGHASGTTAMATYMSLRYPYWYIIAPSVLYASYTYYARMNLGVHYPSDILAGALLGASVAYLAYKLTDTYSGTLQKLVRLPAPGAVNSTPLLSLRISL